MKQDNNELQALENAVNNLNLKGHKVYPAQGYKAKYFLRDNEGNTITGSWDYTRLNHFIMGYGKAFNKFTAEHPEQPIKEDDLDKEVAELEADLWNSPTGTPPIKEQSSNRGEGDILEGKIISDALQQWDNVGYDNTDNPKDTYIAGAKFIGIPLAKENQQLRESNTRLKERIEVLEEALTEWLQLKVHTLRNGIETIDANNKTERAAIVKAKEALNNK